MSLHFLLQSNLVSEEDQQPYIDALSYVARHGLATWSYVKLVPFAGIIEPEQDYGPLVFPIGSTSMLAASQRYNWNPGVVFDPVTFRFEAWRENWGAENLVNGDGELFTFCAAQVRHRGFIRPCEDLKAFSGTVINAEDLLNWQQRVWDQTQSSEDSPLLTPSTPVVVSSPKTITREWRTWVVNGVVVGWSQYGEFGKRVRKRETPTEVIAFSQRLADYWCPADCFVLDVGEVEGRLKLMEINTLNSSGIYCANMENVYAAIASHYLGKQ